LEARRLEALGLLEKGLSQAKVARRLGVRTNTVWRWNQAYRKGGKDALRAKPAPGRKCKLSCEQKQELTEQLLQGARAGGYQSDLWTCPRIALLIRRCYGVSYHIDSLPRFLQALGFSCQRPQKQAAERDEELVAQWVKQGWRRVKKRAPD
jgi:transposase